jgi:hydroxymethylbilane synthase
MACLVVGGGRVACRKAVALAEHGAHVTVVAPEAIERLRNAVGGRESKIMWIRREYSSEDVLGKTLVVAATSDPGLNIRIGREATSSGALSCVVSPGRCSQTVFPALHRAKGVTVAVHSDGRDCGESKRVRDAVADLLASQAEPASQVSVFGAKRDELPAAVFDRLKAVSADGLEAAGVEQPLTVVATCARWECIFMSRHPARTARAIRQAIHETCGVLPEAHRNAFELRIGVRARHHLTRVAVGLDSPLIGETDIVGQVRLAQAELGSGEQAGLQDALAGILRDQKRIRKDSGLERTAPTWSEAVAATACREAEERGRRGVVLWGCGRLSKALARALLEMGLDVVAVSRRAARVGHSWAGEFGITVHEPAQLQSLLGGAGVLVLSSPLTPRGAEALVTGASRGRLAVIDLEGSSSEALGLLGGSHLALSSVGQSVLTGSHAAAAAKAEVLAVAGSVRHATPARVPWPTVLIAGARGSRLARAQVEELRLYLAQLAPQTDLRLRTISTPGDRDKSTPLPAVREGDFFTRDLDEALLNGDIDVAVHSAKDLSAKPVQGLRMAAVTPSPAPWDCLVTRDGSRLSELPAGARIGTSSARRAEGVLRLRPDLHTADIRGNVPDRLKQLDAGDYDGLVLAAVGLIRLGMAGRIAQVFAPCELPPAPGQGQLALVIRDGNERLRRLLAPLDLGDRRWLEWA